VKAILIHTARDLTHPTPAFRDAPNPDTGEAVTYYEGPDFATGYGLLDMERATSFMQAHDADGAAKFTEAEIADGETHTYRVPVGEGGTLRVTLAWDDAAGDPQKALDEPQLVNDLDVVVVAPDGTAHGPWILDPLPLDPQTARDEGIDPISSDDVVGARRCVTDAAWTDDTCVDHRNNVEQVLVDQPEAGWWEIRVRAAAPTSPQRYSLVATSSCQ
jgi:hypothetical protein